MLSRRPFLTTLSALLAATCLVPTQSLADEPVPVVATFSILGDIVARVGGEHIELTTLVGPDGDAHVYQPTPQAARAVAGADVLIMNGLEFEGWLERLVEAANFDGVLVEATEGVTPISFDEHGDHDDHGEHDGHDDHGDNEDNDAHKGHDEHGDHDEHSDHDDHDHGHKDDDHKEEDHHDDHADEDHADEDHAGHDHGAFDPHAWQDLGNAVIYADNIAAALAKAAPEHAAAFYENRATFVAEAEALDAEIAAMIGALPEDKRTVVTSHDAFGYFARAYGLTFSAPQGLSTESDPSASDVAAMITQIREEGISAVFVEVTTDNRLLQQIANETGVAIGGTLYTGALSGPDGPAATYLDMMRYNATTLAEALGG